MKILALVTYYICEKQTSYFEVMRALIEKGISIDLVISNGASNYICDDYYLNQKNLSVQILEPQKGKFRRLFESIFHEESIGYKICKSLLSFIHRFDFKTREKIGKDNRNYVYDVFLRECEKDYELVKDDYDFIWVENERSLLWADWLNAKNDKKYKIIYHCLELFWEHYLLQKRKTPQYYATYILYEEARKILLDTSMILIQDELRWKVLCHFTDLPEDFPKIIFPVAIKDYNVYAEGDLFKRMGVEKGKNVIFYPTILMPERGCIELIDMANELKNDYKVVIHGFYADNQYVDLIREKLLKSKNVILSNSELEYQELLNIHRDIWCLFLYYNEEDNNNKLIANSSNKLAMGLQAGKPLITIGNKMLNDLCKEYKCGVVLKTWTQHEFQSAINEIEKNYDFYCNNARKCYRERYDISLYSDVLYKELLRYSEKPEKIISRVTQSKLVNP